jgi:hypothetical protein
MYIIAGRLREMLSNRPEPSGALEDPSRSVSLGDHPMEYRRQVAMRRDGDDFVIALQPDDVIVFRNGDADDLRKVCRSLRWEIVDASTGSADALARPLAPAEADGV